MSQASNYLIPHWMDRLLEDCEDEEEAGYVLLLSRSGRRLAWALGARLGAARDVPAQACRLLERYLAARFRTGAVARAAELPPHVWRQYKASLGARLPLLMASCMQLAAKMDCAGHQLSARKVRHQLAKSGVSHSLKEVIDSEFHVYQTLEFRVPLWSSAAAAALLARAAGLPARLRAALALTVHYAEYRRDELERRARWAAGAAKDGGGGGGGGGGAVRSLHLAAAAVCAAGRLGAAPRPSPARLAALTLAPPLLISCLADLIVTLLMQDDDSDASD